MNMGSKMEPKVIFEDSEILVLDKPAGMIVNKADTTKGEKTVQEWVETKLKIKNEKLKIDEESDFYKRAGIVHRLDKETSGILLVGKNPSAFANLQAQFKERKVKKTYLALVHGKVSPLTGEINVPLGRLPWNRKKFGVLAGGREAVTEYRVITNFKLQISNEQLTLLEVSPKTGRTHQIRVHLKYFNHPIFGDPLYGGRKTARNDRKFLPRVFLHASKISFFHPARHASQPRRPTTGTVGQVTGVAGRPKTGEIVSFESPLPEDLKHFLSTLTS